MLGPYPDWARRPNRFNDNVHPDGNAIRGTFLDVVEAARSVIPACGWAWGIGPTILRNDILSHNNRVYGNTQP